jgi:hypothetical protein
VKHHARYIFIVDTKICQIEPEIPHARYKKLGEEKMPTMEKKSLDQPEETNTPEKLKMEAVTIRGLTIRRVTALPGWQWSKHLKPVQKTKSCQKDHLLYVISGRLGCRMDDGKEEVFCPGDIGSIPPGHDGWTVGDSPVVWIEIPHQIN